MMMSVLRAIGGNPLGIMAVFLAASVSTLWVLSAGFDLPSAGLAALIACLGAAYWSSRAQGQLVRVAATLLPPAALALVAYWSGDALAPRYYAFSVLLAVMVASILWVKSPIRRLATCVVAPLALVLAIEVAPLAAARITAKLASPASIGDALVATGVKTLDTHFGKIGVREYQAPVVEPTGIYTYLARFEDVALWADANGRFHAIEEGGVFRELSLALDFNMEAFRAAAQRGLQLNRFSVKDIEMHGGHLYVSHSFFHETGACYTLRVSRTPFDRAAFKSDAWEGFETVYETAPCIALAEITDMGQLMEAGGRIAFLDGDLLLTVGDNMHDGREGHDGAPRPLWAQAPDVDYGKTLRIDPETGEAGIFTLGHRNPQGLFVDDSGTVIQTEHGPKGGDELNILTRGLNYGWPLVTLGTEYNKYDWPLNAANGEHLGFEAPRFAWVPAIGISAVLRLGPGLIEAWNGDVMVTSLRARSLFRVRLREGRVMTVEQIEIGFPVRDIIEMEDGRIVLSTTSATVLVLEPAGGVDDAPPIEMRLAAANARTGRDIFDRECSACHLEDASVAGAGPALHRMFAPDIADRAAFDYSAALIDSGVVWNHATLDAWLENPTGAVPGTTMIFNGLADPKDRANLIAYLEEAYRP